MSQVLSAATDALSRLDSSELQRLEERALRLQALLANNAWRMVTTPEIEARHRVFASVVEATGENLGILDRAGSPARYGAPRMRNSWER